MAIGSVSNGSILPPSSAPIAVRSHLVSRLGRKRPARGRVKSGQAPAPCEHRPAPLNLKCCQVSSVRDPTALMYLEDMKKKYGCASHSAWFDPSFSLFYHPGISGLVGFKV